MVHILLLCSKLAMLSFLTTPLRTVSVNLQAQASQSEVFHYGFIGALRWAARAGVRSLWAGAKADVGWEVSKFFVNIIMSQATVN